MAKYDKDFLIEIRPTLTKDAISSMKKEVEQVSETIRKNTKLTYDLDIKKESRVKLKQLKDEIREITGLAKISSKTDLGKVELDDKELEIATKKLNEYRALAKQSSNTRIDANYVQFEKVLKKVEELEATYREIEKLDPSNAEDIKKGNALLEEYEKTAQSIARLGYDKNAFATSLRQQLESQNMERQGTQGTSKITADLKQLTNEAVKSGKEVKDLDKEIKDLGLNDSVGKISTDVKETKKNFDGAARSGRAMTEATKNPQGRKNIDNTQKSAESLTDSFKKMARWGVVAFAWRGITQQIREGIQYIKELDVVLTEIAVVTGKTREEIYDLGIEFNAMAKRLGRTTAEVSNASKIFFRQGKTTEEVMLLVEASTKAASVAHIELAEASDYLTSTLNGFQMEASQAMEVVDKFSAVGANAGTSFEEMAQALKKVASSANNANVDMDHMISYLATVSEVTREAPENIGTSFKTLFARMQKITDGDMPEELNKVDQALGSIGISLTDGAGQIKSLQSIVEDLGGSWQGLTKNQQAYLATSIAGTRQQVRFISLMDNYDRSLEILQTSINSAGEGQLQFNQYLDGFEASLKAAKAEVESLYLALKETGVLEAAVEAFTNFVRAINGFVENSNTLASVITITLVPALTLLALKFIATGKAYAAMQAYMSGGTVIGSLAPQLTSLIAKLSAATVAASTTQVTFTGLTSVMAGTGASTTLLAGSLGTLAAGIGGVIAVGVGLTLFAKEAITHFSDMKREIQNSAEQLKELASQSANLVSLKDKYEDLKNELDDSNITYEDRIEKEKELFDVTKKIGQLLPEVVSARNAEGEAIRINIEDIENEIDAKTRLAEMNATAAMRGETGGFFSGLIEFSQNNPDTLLEWEKRVESLRGHLEAGTAPLGTLPSEVEGELKRAEEMYNAIYQPLTQARVSMVESEGLFGLDINQLEEAIDRDENLLNSLTSRYGDILGEDVENIEQLHEAILKDSIEFRIPQLISEKAYREQFEEFAAEIRTSPKLRKQFNEISDMTYAQLEEAIANGGEDFDLGAISSFQTMMESAVGVDLSNIEVDDLETLFNDLSLSVDKATESTGDFLSLSESLTTQIEASFAGREKLNEYMKEYNKEGEYSAETINKIVREYPDLAGEIENQVQLQELLSKKYGDVTESIKTDMAERLFYNESFENDVKEEVWKTVSEVAEARGVDLENFKDLQQAKLDVLGSFSEAAISIYDKLRAGEDDFGADEVVDKAAGLLDYLPGFDEDKVKEWYKKGKDWYLEGLRQSEDFIQYDELKTSLEEGAEEIQNISLELPDPKSFDSSAKEEAVEAAWAIKDAQIELLETKYDNLDADEKILENSKKMIDNVRARIALEEEKQDLIETAIKNAETEADVLNLENILAQSEGAVDEYQRQLTGFFSDIIEEQKEKRLEAEEEIKDKVIDIYEEQHERRLELENEEYDDFMDKNDDRIDAIKKRHEEEDYRDDLKTLRKDQSKLQDRINEYKLIGSEASRKKILELEEEYAEKEESIQEKKVDRARENEIEAIEGIQDAATEAHNEKIGMLEEEHEEKVRYIEEEFNIAQIATLNLQDITNSFGEQGKSAIGGIITEIDELINKYDEASKMIKKLENIEVENKIGSIRDMSEEDLRTYINNKKVWEDPSTTDEDRTSATEENQRLRDEYGISEDRYGNAKNSWGLDELIRLFNESFNSYATGGVSTKTHFAQLHGTKSRPEFIFNYDQMSALSDIMGGQASQIKIESLINVEGNINDNNVEEVTSAVKSGIEELRRVLGDGGAFTRVSKSF